MKSWPGPGLRPPGLVGRSGIALLPLSQAPQGCRTQPRSSPHTDPSPQPQLLLCALASPARLPAAEVTVSPKRSHSPGSMNPDQARAHQAGRTAACGRERALGPGTALELAASRGPAKSWLRRSETFRAPCPSCAGLDAVGSGFSGSRTTPFAPRPSEGLEPPRWAFEPWSSGGRLLPGAGGARQGAADRAHPGQRGAGAARSGAAVGAGRGGKRGGEAGEGRLGWGPDSWEGPAPACTRACTHTCVHTRTALPAHRPRTDSPKQQPPPQEQ